jgi:UDP-GlcNAc:undecaprenyl-phosphate GlcNAc-1-phosphate transferase
LESAHGLILLSAGIFAAMVAAVATPNIAGWARRRNLVDRPDPRKQHETPVALLGGISVLASMALCSIGAVWIFRGEFRDPLSGASIRWLVGCSIGAAILALVGLRDDIRPLSIPVKITAQLVSAGVLLFLVRSPNPVTETIVVSLISLGWLVLITNSVNLIDNMDGLAPGIGALAAGFFAILAGGEGVSLVCAALAGALVGFLVHNRHPARVFLGDGGSLPIGFLLGAAGLWIARGSDEASLGALLVLGVPLLDSSLVVISRLRRGLNPLTTPGRDHISHRLVALGLPIPVAVGLLWVLGLGSGLAGLAVTPPQTIDPWIVVTVAITIWLGVIVIMEKLAPAGLTRPGETEAPRTGETT